MNSFSEIIIIGAGASGLLAGHLLASKGNKVKILEARARIGGRIQTLANEGFTRIVEAGAEFVHGSPEITKSLIRAAGEETRKAEGEIYNIHQGKRKTGNDDMNWDRVISALDSLDQDVPVAQFLDAYFPKDKSPELYQMVSSFVEGFDAADPEKFSSFILKNDLKQQNDEDQHRLLNGYASIIRYLEKEFLNAAGTIDLSSVVKRISWKKGEVQIETTDGTQYRCEKILVTVPISLLQDHRIEFSPSIPDYFEAARQIGYGGVVKYQFEFHPDFWNGVLQKKMKNMMFIFSDAKVPTWWSQLPDQTPLLTGWLGGPGSFSVPRNPDALFSLALDSIDYIFRIGSRELTEGLRKWKIADWVSDPFSCGAYSYSMLHSAEARKKLNTPIDNTIFFAGEALAEGKSMATVEAAFSSGKQTANAILKTI